MCTARPSAVYNCVLPEKPPFTKTSGVYHSPSNRSGEAPQKPFFLAWPHIVFPHSTCCLPSLIRGIYRFSYGVAVEPEEAVEIAKDYVSGKEEIASDIRLTVLDLLEDFHRAVKFWAKTEDLSPLGKYGKNSQESSDTQKSLFDFLRTWTGKPASIQLGKAFGPYFQALAFGMLQNFPGATTGEYDSTFSNVHELAHASARWSYSGIVQDGLSKRIHKIIYTLATENRLSQKKRTQLWEEFDQLNERLEHLTRIFEPLEESYATYISLLLLPPEVRINLEASLEMQLKEKHWYSTYKAFVTACSYRLVTPDRAAFYVFEAACYMLKHIDIDSAKLLCTWAKIRKVYWSSYEKIMHEHGNSLNTAQLEALVERDSSKEINRLLDEGGTPRDVYRSTLEMLKTSVYTRLTQAISSGTLINDKELLGILCAPQIILEGRVKLIGGSVVREVTPLIISWGFQQEETDNLSPSIRVICESLRVQIMKLCGPVCPLAFKGQDCCGRKQWFQRLFKRLPRDVKSNYEMPNCDRIR